MQMKRTRALTAGTAAVVVALVGMSVPYLDARPAGQQATFPGGLSARAASRGWDTFSADLAIRQGVVGADGQPIPPAAPAVTVRLERQHVAARWRTSMTLQRVEAPTILGLVRGDTIENPFSVVRMEYDEDGTPPRMYDRRGRLVRSPGEADRRLLNVSGALQSSLPGASALAGRVPAPPGALVGYEWVDAVIAAPGKRAVRRAALERQLGPSIGRVRGLDRFLARTGEITREVLVDPELAVPVELNTTRDGELATRTTFTHTREPDGAITRRTTHTERALPGAKGDRVVLDLELANIQLTTGRAQ